MVIRLRPVTTWHDMRTPSPIPPFRFFLLFFLGAFVMNVTRLEELFVIFTPRLSL